MDRDDQTGSVKDPLDFLARIAALCAVACGIGLWLLRWFFSRDLGVEFGAAFYMLKHLIAFLVPALAFCFMSVLLLASSAVFIVALFASHKVAGPLFRLQRVASYLQRNILVGRIHLRIGDQGKSVATGINAWVEGRKQQLRRLQAEGETAEAHLRECKMRLALGDRQGVEQALEGLRSLFAGSIRK